MTRPRESVLVVMQLISMLATIWALMQPFDFSNWMLSLLGYTLILGLGLTVTFHRLLAHRSYRLAKPLEYLFSFFGNIGCTGSSVGWVYVHRMHHMHTDEKGDPHSPHILGKLGAIVGQYGGKFNKWAVRDVIDDPIHRFYHDYHMLLIIGTLVLLWLVSPTLAVYLYLIPVFMSTMVSRLSNWIDHEPAFGVQLPNAKDHARNVWWWSYISFGEGWHSNHHSSPGNYQYGIKWWEFDPGKYFIRFLMFLGLAKQRG